MDEMDEVKGIVSTIIFHNDNNFYSIIKVKDKKSVHTVVGTMPEIRVGENVEFQGEWITHSSYGKQLKAHTMKKKAPKAKDDLLMYLSSGCIEGIGESTAKKLLKEFGDKVLDVIEKDYKKLTEIKGITEPQAKKIHESYGKQIGARELLTFLASQQISLAVAPILTKYYGTHALKLLKDNPYLLSEEEYGIPFYQVEQLALALEIPKTQGKRIQAGVVVALREIQNRGHSCLPMWELVKDAVKLLHCSGAEVEESFPILEEKGKLVIEEFYDVPMVYPPLLHEAESNISLRVSEMCQAQLLPPEKLAEMIEQIQKDQNISYSPEQCEAVELAAKHQIMLLTGGPGTGKTTSLKAVLALFQHLKLKTALAAPTGRAAQRLGDLCGSEASTIHRLLEVGFDANTGDLVFQRDADDPISADAVIVDETSMLDIVLMSHLLEALPNDCRLILVGDPDQLPSVGAGNLFADLIDSGLVPMVRLSRIFRQAQESNIISNAHKVNQGITPDMANVNGDYFFLPRNTAEETLETIVELCLERLPKNKGILPEQIQVLSPTRQKCTGTESLNKALQDALNPPEDEKREKLYGAWVFREGDRVMQVRNNYDIPWKMGAKKGVGVFNGDIGTVDKVTSDTVTVSFEGKQVQYGANLLAQLEPAYAITVHKAQGSEYDVVIFAAFDGSPLLMTRGILYTAITRSKTLFIAVGNPYVMANMTANVQQIQRYSCLKLRLREVMSGTADGGLDEVTQEQVTFEEIEHEDSEDEAIIEEVAEKVQEEEQEEVEEEEKAVQEEE